MAKHATATSAFGVSRRESHDASGFYSRFTRPDVTADATIADHRDIDRIIVGDARSMDAVPDASVALVVTSPPYFAGKQYEEALGSEGIPATYLDYLQLLREVFAECVRTLEPGGRIAVNVANLGRRPFRSLSADVTGILQDDLRLLLRGEIVWMKQRGSAGSCAWGSFQRASNPVLRDLTERVIVASKGRFDRAVPTMERRRRGLPHESTMTREDFMEDTLDVWEIPSESATRIGHPAPFPLELPERLIQLYTYRDDLVLDPFIGAGTTAVAALRQHRHFVGYDLDPSYAAISESRLDHERERLFVAAGATAAGASSLEAELLEGRSAKELCAALLEASGLTIVKSGVRMAGGLEVSFLVEREGGRRVLVDVAGGFTSNRGGLARSEIAWKTIAKAAVVSETAIEPFVVVTAELPRAKSAMAAALREVTGEGRPIRAIVHLFDADAPLALRSLASD